MGCGSPPLVTENVGVEDLCAGLDLRAIFGKRADDFQSPCPVVRLAFCCAQFMTSWTVSGP